MGSIPFTFFALIGEALQGNGCFDRVPKTRHNTVQLGKLWKDRACEALGVKQGMINKYIRQARDAEILIPVYSTKTNKQYRGTYLVNPFIIALGSWDIVKQLRASIDFGSPGQSTIELTILDGETEKLLSFELPLCFANEDDNKYGRTFLRNDNEEIDE